MCSCTTAQHIYCTNAVQLYSLQLNCTYSNYTEAAATCSAAQQHNNCPLLSSEMQCSRVFGIVCVYMIQSYPVISSFKETQMTDNALPQLHSATQNTHKVLLGECKRAVFADSSARMRRSNSGMWRDTSCRAWQGVSASAPGLFW
jgi:hypothetical protein